MLEVCQEWPPLQLNHKTTGCKEVHDIGHRNYTVLHGLLSVQFRLMCLESDLRNWYSVHLDLVFSVPIARMQIWPSRRCSMGKHFRWHFRY